MLASDFAMNPAVHRTNTTQVLSAMAGYAEGITSRAIASLGMAILLYIALYQVVISKTKTLADFITLVTYWTHLYRKSSVIIKGNDS